MIFGDWFIMCSSKLMSELKASYQNWWWSVFLEASYPKIEVNMLGVSACQCRKLMGVCWRSFTDYSAIIGIYCWIILWWMSNKYLEQWFTGMIRLIYGLILMSNSGWWWRNKLTQTAVCGTHISFGKVISLVIAVVMVGEYLWFTMVFMVVEHGHWPTRMIKHA